MSILNLEYFGGLGDGERVKGRIGRKRVERKEGEEVEGDGR